MNKYTELTKELLSRLYMNFDGNDPIQSQAQRLIVKTYHKIEKSENSLEKSLRILFNNLTRLERIKKLVVNYPNQEVLTELKHLLKPQLVHQPIKISD